jgi:hypothetical protein
MITDETEHESGNGLCDTDLRIGNEKNLCQGGSQESHRAATGYTNECAEQLEQVEADPELMD